MTDTVLTTPKPLAVKWIVGLGWLRLAFYALIVFMAFYFLSTPPEGGSMAGFRKGWLESARIDPATYGAEQAGQIVGSGLIPAVLSVFLLLAVRKRKLKALRIIASVIVLVSITQPGASVLSIVILILTLRPSTKQYCLAAADAEKPPVVPGVVVDR